MNGCAIVSVREVGLMVSGLAVVRTQYRSREESADDTLLLRDGLLTAVSDFASQVFQDQMETFEMKELKIVILSGQIKVGDDTQTLLVYAICDREVRQKSVREALTRIHESFVEAHPSIDRVIVPSKYREFAKTIDKILGDLVLRPQDRIQRIL